MFAEVIVDISSGEVDRIFDYEVSGEMSVGTRVLVPFGKREIEGYIIKLKETSLLPPDKIKPIIRAIDNMPVISDEMLKLTEHMIKLYHLRYIDILRLFIPSQMRGGRVKELTRQHAFLSPEYTASDIDLIIKPSATAQKDIFCYLLQHGSEAVAELNKNFSAAALRNLTARGIVQIKSLKTLRTPYKDIDTDTKKITLTTEQTEVIDKIINSSDKTFLLHGVTGSGKTEVYMNCISEVLKNQKTAIMLVPEISLTPQVLKNFRFRFGQKVAILHSGLSAGERFDEWQRLLTNEAQVAIGARSAIFAPLKNLGLIIIDEEHDSSYISESNPRYSTHEVAEFRRAFNKCNSILGSATPSIESYYKAQNGEYNLLNLSKRINQRPMPKIELVDMCKEFLGGNNGIFSNLLLGELDKTLSQNNQAIIFINRRGYSSYVMCRSCGYTAKCAQCDVSLVYHRAEKVLKCHYCGNRYSSLDICPECKSTHIKQGYVGTEQVVEKLEEFFPKAKILRMDNDTTQNKDSHLNILTAFAQKQADILVGTQMIAKGHDFADVTTVGIIDADMSLHFSDFRSNERTFQLITQVSGRAGRDNKSGTVVLQTYTPSHYVYKFAINNDYKSFYEKECNLREVAKFPPFSRIIRVLLSGENEQQVADNLKAIYQKIQDLQAANKNSFIYLAAMRSPIKKIQNKYRMQIIARIESDFLEICRQIYDITDECKKANVLCFTEINPSNLS